MVIDTGRKGGNSMAASPATNIAAHRRHACDVMVHGSAEGGRNMMIYRFSDHP